MKKTALFVSLLVVAMLLVAAAPSLSPLVRFTVINNLSEDEANGGLVQIQLNWSHATDATQDLFYYFQVQPGTSSTFTVPRHEYDAKVWACSRSTSATVDLLTSLTLSFPRCNYAPNAGEPSMEKVVLKLSPGVYIKDDGWYNLQEWRFQYVGYSDNPGRCMIVDQFGIVHWAEDGTTWIDDDGALYTTTCQSAQTYYRPSSTREWRPSKVIIRWY